ncbi:hypothetical protein DP939_34770 [Spongiactinospora rosea]|uniref:Uncharacterized protein n=2 Tax=Spongiactinospora rosea TaxID=2248750 RepID=A0A366LNP9_9ACTN|nr:hypothetical protein DP939_34770 [Spongiactinospora rosea]
MGAVLVSDVALARSPNVVITVPTIRAFSTGCLIEANVVMRQHTLSAEDYEALGMSVYPHMIPKAEAGQLPERLLRFGVRFGDGTKATTVGQRFDGVRLRQDPPSPPRLSLLFGGVSMRSGGEDAAVSLVGLWLWPLPPAETFELAAEWPAGGVELSIVSVDGAAIVAAARRSVPYWPEDAESG